MTELKVMPETRNLFTTEGCPIEAGSHQPFPVDNPQYAWFVASGMVDVFVLPMAHGKPAGPRTHLLRAGPGQVIFGLALDRAEYGLGFVAVGGPDTCIHRLPVARLGVGSGDAAADARVQEWVETWVEALYSGLAAGLAPTDCEVVQAGDELSAEAGTVIRPADRVIWAQHREGQSLLGGLEGLAVRPVDGPFPLAASAWLVTAAPSTLVCLDTATVLREGQVWSSLPGFSRLAARWAAARINAAEKAEALRLEAKAGAQHQAMRSAVSHLSAVLAPARSRPLAADGAADPLVAACQLVGQAMGIQITPPSSARMAWRTADPLVQIAKTSRFRARRVALAADWWTQDNGPLLAFRAGGNQPVALIPSSSTRYHLVDPATGTRDSITEEVARGLGALAFSFCPTLPDRALKVWEVFQFGLRNMRAEVAALVLLGLAGAGLGLVFPIITGLVFDAVIPNADRSQLWFLAATLMVASSADVVLGITQSVALIRIEAKSHVRIQAAVWDRLLRLPLPFFRNYTAGDLAMRANGINAIRQILSGAMITSLLSAVFSVLYFGLLFHYSPTLTVVACGLVLLNLAVIGGASALTLRLERPAYELEGRISGMVLQFITGIAKLRVAGAESQAFAVWAKAFGAQKRLDWRAGMLGNAFAVFNELFPMLTTMLLFVGMAFWAESGMSAGKFLAFSAAFMTFLHATVDASAAALSVVHAVPIYERIKPILVALPEVTDHKADPGPLTGRIELSHVSFRYRADGPLVLEDLSLQVRPGEFVALVGASGSGKSTLFRLLLGFETLESGTILYDGLDLTGLDIQAVRRQCGVVLQNGKLMPGDIFENIVGTSLLTLEDAWEAARLSGLEEDIQALPMGMHTVLGEGASTFSGGQRQRLMIARAIVTKPRILLFDEATSALDNRTQAIVSRSLESLKATRIVIAHRLSTIQNADRLFVLKQGRLVQSGTYAQLADQPGPFAELARRQLA